MKVIFLDIDGVLNPLFQSYPKFLDTINIDITRVKYLKDIVNATNAKIVLSSSWRNHQKSLNDIALVLSEYDICYTDITPNCEGELSRGEEISRWLSNQKEDIQYIILDDYPPTQFLGLEDRLVNINFKTGLTEEDVMISIEKLGSI